MAEKIAKVERFSIAVADQAGEGARVLGALAAGKADLVAAWGYPVGEGNARIDVIPTDSKALKAAAKGAGIKLKRESAAFCVEGRNKPGVVAAVLAKLAEAGINVHAVQAVATGTKYAAVIVVDSKHARKAAKALGV